MMKPFAACFESASSVLDSNTPEMFVLLFGRHGDKLGSVLLVR